MSRVIEEVVFRTILEHTIDRISRGGYRDNNYRNGGYNRDRDRSRERSFSGNYGGNRARSASNSRSRSGSRASTNRDRTRCYNCREYDHFARDCPNSREERDIDQLQQMLNLKEEEQTHLLMGTQSNPVENPRTSPLKLMNGRDGTTTFLPHDTKIGGQLNHDRPSVGQFLTREQASYIYKKVESGETINVDTIQ